MAPHPTRRAVVGAVLPVFVIYVSVCDSAWPKGALRTPPRYDRKLGGIYVDWHSRAIGRLRESAEATERAFLLDALSPMSANLVALSRMATGRVREAVPLF